MGRDSADPQCPDDPTPPAPSSARTCCGRPGTAAGRRGRGAWCGPRRCPGGCRAWRSTSWKWTGRSLACSPRRLVEPITWPVRMPPPASRAHDTCGQWSRPASLVDLRRAAELAPHDDRHVVEHAAAGPGLRPAADSPGRAAACLRGPCSKFWPCQSQRLKASVTQRAPASTSRRAIRKFVDQPRAAVVAIVRLALAVPLADLRVFLRRCRAPRPACSR